MDAHGLPGLMTSLVATGVCLLLVLLLPASGALLPLPLVLWLTGLSVAWPLARDARAPELRGRVAIARLVSVLAIALWFSAWGPWIAVGLAASAAVAETASLRAAL
jgi:hypothetical protein